MLDTLSEVVRNIVVLIIMVTILELLLPRNHFRPFVNMVVGLVLMLMLLSPFRSLLQFPGTLEPMLEMRMSISESEVAERHAMLEQVNWDLTLDRYRTLMLAKITGILVQEGLTVVEITLKLEENVNHPEFGQPQQVVVLAKRGVLTETGLGQVEKVEIEIGMPAPEIVPETVGDSRLERLIGEALGVDAKKIEVQVLSGE